jgi:hypothetical protein
MAEVVAEIDEDAVEKPVTPVHRLCNEIQLFDLCEQVKCNHKQGLFCTNRELLDRFEAIAEEDERTASRRYNFEEGDDAPESDDDEYDDSCDDELFGDEGYEEGQGDD